MKISLVSIFTLTLLCSSLQGTLQQLYDAIYFQRREKIEELLDQSSLLLIESLYINDQDGWMDPVKYSEFVWANGITPLLKERKEKFISELVKMLPALISSQNENEHDFCCYILERVPELFEATLYSNYTSKGITLVEYAEACYDANPFNFNQFSLWWDLKEKYNKIYGLVGKQQCIDLTGLSEERRGHSTGLMPLMRDTVPS